MNEVSIFHYFPMFSYKNTITLSPFCLAFFFFFWKAKIILTQRLFTSHQYIKLVLFSTKLWLARVVVICFLCLSHSHLVKLKAKVQALPVLWKIWKQLANCRLHLQVLQMGEFKHLLRDCWNFVPVQFQYLKCGRQIVKGTRLHGGYSVTVNVPVETMSRKLNLQVFNNFLIPNSETQSSYTAYSTINSISLIGALDNLIHSQIVFHHQYFRSTLQECVIGRW